MNYIFYLHAAAGTLDASTAPFFNCRYREARNSNRIFIWLAFKFGGSYAYRTCGGVWCVLLNLAGLRMPLSAARQLYIHRRAANKITSQSWSLVLTAATAKLGILIEFLFGWLLNLAEFWIWLVGFLRLSHLRQRLMCAFKFGWLSLRVPLSAARLDELSILSSACGE